MYSRVLVLLSTYNGEVFLEAQLDSILAQTGINLHILIRDDGSDDKTQAILKKYKDIYPSVISIILSGKNLGSLQSFSALVEEAFRNCYQFDYFAFCDQDDVWQTDKLSTAVNMLNKNRNDSIPRCYISNVDVVDADLRNPKPLYRHLPKLTKDGALVQNFAIGCTMVFNVEAVQKYKCCTLSTNTVHDYWMYLICMYMGEVIYDSVPHILYRQHSGNQIGTKSFLSRMARRLSTFKKSRDHYISQASNFILAYGDCLSHEDYKLISSFCNYKEKFIDRLSFAIRPGFRYDSFEFNFFRFIKILMGRL